MSLEPEREKNLWRLCSQGDMEAREELIVAYRPLVFWIAGKIHVNDTELKQDIIQEGMLALINAVDKFEPEREFKFSTYAYHKIHGQIINMLERSEKKAPLPVPDEWLQIAEDNSEDDESGEEWLDVAQSISKLEGREAEIVSAIFLRAKSRKKSPQKKN